MKSGFSKAYANKLLDGRWQKKRLEVLNRDGFMCTNCGRQHNVQVHHNWYLKNYEPWDYGLDQLVTLCGDHHEEIGHLQEGIKRLLSTTGPEDQKKVYDFLMALKQEKRKEAEPAKEQQEYERLLTTTGEHIAPGWYICWMVGSEVIEGASGNWLSTEFYLLREHGNDLTHKQGIGLWANNESERQEARFVLSQLARAISVLSFKDAKELHGLPCEMLIDKAGCYSDFRPLAVRLTATSGEHWRIHRLAMVVSFLKEMDQGTLNELLALQDHEGNLTCEWKSEPSDNNCASAAAAWDCVGEDASTISHSVLH